MKPIVVRQYELSEPFWPEPSVLRSLAVDYRKRIDLRPVGDGRISLVGGAYVGVIRAANVDVLIQPRVPTLSVFWMLGYAQRMVKLLPHDFAVDVEAGLLDVLARLFARQTELIIRRGLYREYVEREDNVRFIRGRILPLEDMRQNRGLRHVVACRFTDLTADVFHNQVLRSVTDVLLRFRFNGPGITELLAWNAAHLAEVTPVRLVERDLAGLRYGRLNARYEPVHALARLILRHLTFALEEGTERTPSFLVNMNLVYQEFLTRIVEERARSVGLRLRRPGRLLLDRDGRVPVEPDIVLEDALGVRAAIDAKYKPEIATGDIYQALAYAKALRLNRVALVYPADGNVMPTEFRMRHDDVTILVRTVPVGHDAAGFVDLDLRARAAASELIREVAMAGVEAAA